MHRFRLAPLALVLAGCLLSPLNGQASQELLPAGSTWRYLDNGVYPGITWTLDGFDDSAWNSGPGQFGYGDGDESTTVDFGPDPEDKHITTWFRTEFDYDGIAPVLALRLELLRDDGAVVYLNGEAIARDRLQRGNVRGETLSDGSSQGAEESTPQVHSLDAGDLAIGTNQLAVEVHQNSARGSDLSFDLAVEGLGHHVLVRGPYLQSAAPGAMRVRWRTSGPTDSLLQFGTTPQNLSQTVSDSTLKREHELVLDGLVAGATYYYRVGHAAETYPLDPALSYPFRVPQAIGTATPFRAWILGDPGTGDENARSVRDAWLEFSQGVPPDLLLLLGDNAYPVGSDADYQHGMFAPYGDILATTPVWPARGNHDESDQAYADIFDPPTAAELGGVASGSELYYSFDQGNVHFICLDSTNDNIQANGPMGIWLEADLAATNRDWIVAFWHHPPYTKGTHNSDTGVLSKQMREAFVPLLEAGGVDLVLGGHSHVYERSMLITGHHDVSTTFVPSMLVDGGDGRPEGDGAYNIGPNADAGTLYVVAGSSGTTREAPYPPHPVSFVRFDETLGSLVLDVDGGRMDLTFVDSKGDIRDTVTLLNETYVGQYCQAPISSQGCQVTVTTNGAPSVSGGSFQISATQTNAGSAGLFFYGLEPAAMDLATGRLCVGGSPARVGFQGTGGMGACTGRMDFDFGALLQSGSDPNLVPGVTVYTQAWIRDPLGTPTSIFSAALQFVVQP